MSKFYCSKCEKSVELKNGKCPFCKTNWEKIISERDNKREMPNKEEIIRQLQENQKYTECQFCKERMRADAIICPHCRNRQRVKPKTTDVIGVIGLYIVAIFWLFIFSVSGVIVPFAFFAIFLFIAIWYNCNIDKK